MRDVINMCHVISCEQCTRCDVLEWIISVFTSRVFRHCGLFDDIYDIVYDICGHGYDFKLYPLFGFSRIKIFLSVRKGIRPIKTFSTSYFGQQQNRKPPNLLIWAENRRIVYDSIAPGMDVKAMMMMRRCDDDDLWCVMHDIYGVQ